ncbi:Heterokaryon incompatibility protein (HET) domain containing protein, partial [Naviculisporaceae sp. PSN 640]
TASRGCQLCTLFLKALRRSDDRRTLRIDQIVAEKRVTSQIRYLRVCAVRRTPSRRDSSVSLFVDLIPILPGGGSGSSKEIGSAELRRFSFSEWSHLLNNEAIDANTDSEASCSLVRNWLNTCLNNHLLCNKKVDNIAVDTPTRLIYLPESGVPRLMIMNDTRSPLQYVTLSHCWGSELPLQLTTTNLGDLQVEIPPAQLSKTFKDAFKVAQRMGIHYIWIDSLCIIQDSTTDWLVESSRMGDVYANSYCNIAADHAPDGTYGCYIERDPNMLRPPIVRFGWGLRPGSYILTDDIYDNTDVSHEALGKRGWVCQERFLSPRIVHFTSTQIHWECSELYATEIFPRGEPGSFSLMIRHHKGFSILIVTTPLPSDLKPLLSWNRVINSYVSRELTYPSDKLVAISGLAVKFQRYTNCQYFAGLWETHFVYQLLWAVRGYPELGVQHRVEPYIAPSWSWASMEGRISTSDGDMADTGPQARTAMVEVLEIKVDLADSGIPFGHVTSGHLRLHGPVTRRTNLTIRPDTKSMSTPDIMAGEEPIGFAAIDNRSLYEHDNPPGSAALKPADEDLWYLPIVVRNDLKDGTVTEQSCNHHWPWLKGLILQPVPDSHPDAHHFTRVGWFQLHGHIRNSEKFQGLCRLAGEEDGIKYEEGDVQDAWGPRRVITVF